MDPDVPDGVRVLDTSQSQKAMENMLLTYYTPMEVWYARSVIDKVRTSILNLM